RHTSPGDFLFPAPDGRGREHSSAAAAIKRAVERAGLEGHGITAHSFSHTFDSVLIARKHDPVKVAAMIGDTVETTMNTYAHAFDKARQEETLRDDLDQGYGHLLTGNTMSTEGRNQPKPTLVKMAQRSQVEG